MYTLAKRFLVYSHPLMKGIPNWIFFKIKFCIFEKLFFANRFEEPWKLVFRSCEDAKLILEQVQEMVNFQ